MKSTGWPGGLWMVLLAGTSATAQTGEPLPDTYGGAADVGVQPPAQVAGEPDDAERTDRASEGSDAPSEGARQGQRQMPLQGGVSISGRAQSIHVVQRNDTLWDLSDRFYGDPWHWPRLWSYNPQITNPHWIYPGDRIRLREAAPRAAGPGDGTLISEADLQQPDAIPERAYEPDTVFLRHQGYLGAKAIESAGLVMGAREDHMLLAPYDDVYVRLREGAAPAKPGQRLTVFKRQRPEERLAHVEGELVRILGTIQVREYDSDTRLATGILVEALDPIERGHRVAPMQRRFDVVAPRRNAKDLDARIVAAFEPKQLLAEHNIVFLNVGSRHGVRAGNRFSIVRRGDSWRDSIETAAVRMGASRALPSDDDVRYPKEVVAEARVLHVRPDTLTALITRSVEVVQVGDVAEMRAGY